MVELYPHQKKAVRELHNGAILWGDVGTGKSLTAAAYYVENEAPKDVIVITTAKKRDSLDWVRDFAKFAIGRQLDSTVAGVLTVDSWNNIGRYRDHTGCFFIFDEQRVVGSGKWTKDFIRIARNNRWILLTATPGDTWLDYVPVFLANGFYKNRTEFLRDHVIYNRWSKFPKVDRYVGVGKLVKYKNKLLVHMPYERHTTRKTAIVPVEYDQDLFEKVLEQRWNVYENRPLRDVAELFAVMRKVANSNSSRLKSVVTLLKLHPKVIVFYNFDYELEQLRTLGTMQSTEPSMVDSGSTTNKTTSTYLENESCPTTVSTKLSEPSTLATEPRSSCTASTAIKNSSLSITPSTPTTSTTTSGERSTAKNAETSWKDSLSQPSNSTNTDESISQKTFSVAEWNGHKHEPIPTTDRWVYLVQYQAGAEGWNCIETDAMVFYSLTYSYKNWHQAHGRIDRLNTPFSVLHYYVLLSNSVIDKAIMKSLKTKKSFNESRFMKKITTIHSQEKSGFD